MVAKTNSNVNTANYNPVKLALSKGNKKLVSNEALRFLIWNIPAVVTCPYRTPSCEELCYAKKAESGYRPDVLPSRLRNLEETKKPEFALNMIYTIDSTINNPRAKVYDRAEKIVVRIHESGDFYNKAYADAWRRVAEYFVTNPGANGHKLVFMAYTKSVSFFIGEQIPENMVVRYSIWKDTKPEELEKSRALNLPTYTAVETFEGFSGCRCRCVDCATCGLCWNKNAHTIACEIH